ncbi:MAG: hypothetical protein H0U59_00845 [Gemmatimonadaceae bacterium]|nr:hypothetical protein [Gemmatimonadaceae bacterium]
MDDANTVIEVGQNLTGTPTYVITEIFLNFDTSSIPDDATITAVTLRLRLAFDLSTTDFIMRARERDWGDTLEAADWASVYTDTLLATLDSAGLAGSYNSFVSQAAFIAAVNKTGRTRFFIHSSLQESNTAPTGLEFVDFRANEDINGTPPQLDVTYSVPEAPLAPATSQPAIAISHSVAAY